MRSATVAEKPRIAKREDAFKIPKAGENERGGKYLNKILKKFFKFQSCCCIIYLT